MISGHCRKTRNNKRNPRKKSTKKKPSSKRKKSTKKKPSSKRKKSTKKKPSSKRKRSIRGGVFDKKKSSKKKSSKKKSSKKKLWGDVGIGLSHDQMWNIIEHVEWREKNNDAKVIKINELLNKKLSEGKFEQLNEFAVEKAEQLDKINGKKTYPLLERKLGDDLWGDLKGYVVGRGEKFYNNITVEKLQKIIDYDKYHNFLIVFLDV
jgi:hypothetical protein